MQGSSSSQAAGRAVVGVLSPPARLGEFFGLWGLAVKTASIFGPLTYGLVTWIFAGNHRLGIFAVGSYFVIGLVLLAGIDIEALSVGGIETCIHLPRHKLAFDIGRCPPEVVKVETVLFTHAHMDHMGGVAFHTSTRSLRNMRPPTYVIPAVYEQEFFDCSYGFRPGRSAHQALSKFGVGELRFATVRRVRQDGESGILCYGYKFVPVRGH